MIEFLCNQRECNDLSCISRKRIFTAAPLSHPSGSNKLSSPLVATLTNFSSSGTESSAMKVKLQWQMPMNCSSFLRGATPRGFFTLGRWIHSHQEKEISPAGWLVHFRFSFHRERPIFLFGTWDGRGWKNGPVWATVLSARRTPWAGDVFGARRESVRRMSSRVHRPALGIWVS